MVAVNILVNHRGDTVLVRGWDVPVLGNTDVTLESMVDGAVLGSRVVVAVIVFAVYSACVDPDRVLRALRPIARRSAMSAGLVTRMVPLAVSDGARLREAAALRGPAATPVGRGALARRVVESSLDRAVDVAATLELRGHSLPTRARPRSQRSRDTVPVAVSRHRDPRCLPGRRDRRRRRVRCVSSGSGSRLGRPRSLSAGSWWPLAAAPFAVRMWRSRG